MGCAMETLAQVLENKKCKKMIIDYSLLDKLTLQAKATPRLRINYDLRDSKEDESQRMLNAIEPGTVIHRHTQTSEDVVILRGRAEEVFYDNTGKETGRYLLVPGSDTPAIHVPMGQYHTCQSLESGTVIIEFKNTKYDPETTEDIL